MSAEQDRDVLAAEYVLGTLGPEERAEAQALIAVDAGFAETVRGWERRLGELSAMVDPVEPPADMWDRIKAGVAVSDHSARLMEPAIEALKEPAKLPPAPGAVPPAAVPATPAPPASTPARAAGTPPGADAAGPVFPATGMKLPPASLPPASGPFKPATDPFAPTAAATAAPSQKLGATNAAEAAAAELDAVAAELAAAAAEREAAAAKPEAPVGGPEEKRAAAAGEPVFPASPARPLPPLIPVREPRAVEPDDDDRVVVLARRVVGWRKAALTIGTLAACLVALVAVQHTNPDLLPSALQPPRQVVELTRTVEVPSPRPAEFVAVLQRDAASPAFLLTFDLDKRMLTVRTVGAERQAGKSYELWLVSDKFPAPRSLGVIGPTPYTVRPAEPDYDPVIINRATYAVSLEPEGGSPTGAPTGPVLYSGRLLQATAPDFPARTP